MCKIVINKCIDCETVIETKIKTCPISEGFNLCVNNLSERIEMMTMNKHGFFSVDVSRFMMKDVIKNKFVNHVCM